MTGKKCAYNTIIIYKYEDEVYVNKRNVKLWHQLYNTSIDLE